LAGYSDVEISANQKPYFWRANPGPGRWRGRWTTVAACLAGRGQEKAGRENVSLDYWR